MEQAIQFQSPITPARPMVGADYGLRVLAKIIDFVPYLAVRYGIALLAGLGIVAYASITQQPYEPFLARLQSTTVPSAILMMVGSLLYETCCEGLHGATLGKLILRLHVLSEDGSPASLGAAFVRSLYFYADGFYFGFVGWSFMRSSELNQRYGDKVAKTVVVQRSKFMQCKWPSGLRFMAAFALGLSLDALLCFFALVLQVM